MSEPEDRLDPQSLKAAVYAGFDVFAKVNVCKKEVVYGYFKGSFKHELSEWGRGNKPISFTETLTRIFSGEEHPDRIEDQGAYDKAIRLIAANPRFREQVGQLAGLLANCRNQQVLRAANEGCREAVDLLASEIAKHRERQAQAKSKSDGWLLKRRFPDHIQDIVRLVRSAQQSVAIHADTVDYGSFRNFALHRDLLNAIVQQAMNGRKIEFLIWTDQQPMSWVNRFRKPQARSGPKFVKCLATFLDALKETTLEASDEYRGVAECLRKGADWVDPYGDIRRLLRLQMKLHQIEFRELKNANVLIQSSNKEADLSSIGTDKDEPWPGMFYWVVDGVRGIFVLPIYGTDAEAHYIDDQSWCHSVLGNFKSILTG
jgi:hypothetical protein